MGLKDKFTTIKNKSLDFFKKQFQNKRRVVLFVITLLLLFVYVVLGAVSKMIVSGLPEYLLADRWSDKNDMAQISIYTTEDQIIDEDSLKRFEYQLEKKLADSGVKDPDLDDDGNPKTGPEVVDTIGIDEMDEAAMGQLTVKERKGIRRLFAVSCCAQGQATLTFENRTAENAAAIGVSGDFFLFHPMNFVSGSAFSGDDLMKDSIVIDEDMAWQLFGSTDIIGQSVLIGGVPHYIEGVIKRDSGRIAKASGLDKSYVFMSYDSLSKYGTILSGRVERKEIAEDGTSAEVGGINCIEVVCPNPVRGLAARIAKEALGVKDEFVSVIDNTDRFSFIPLLTVIRSYGTRSMWNKAIYYPYWENMARGYEDILATMLFIRMLCLLFAILFISIGIINAYRNKTWTVRSVVRDISDKIYDYQAEHKKSADANS